MKWIYKGERRLLFGRWCYSGDIISNPTKPPGKWVKKGKEEKETIDEKVGQTDDSDRIERLKEELSKMKMYELRKIGKEYNAYDTKKSELVDEIIRAKINRGEL